jgi:quercetin dioxygenase-like cupin family protein
MRRTIVWAAIALVSIVGSLVAQEATTPKPSHTLVNAANLKWGPPPGIFEQKGATFTVISGDPSQSGIFVVRLKLQPGYRIAPHWHPTDEHVTVLSGTFQIGMGDTFDRKGLQDVSSGGYVLLPAEMRHYAMAKTLVEVQVHGMGPFALNYVNPADDPSKRVSESTKGN